jgi:hypothetical protein
MNHQVDSAESLYRSLLAAGSISDDEYFNLLTTARKDRERDQNESATRLLMIDSDIPAYQTKESKVNPRTMIDCIERNRAVIEAQVQVLDELVPANPLFPLDQTERPLNVTDLLQHTMQVSLRNAAETLQAASQAEARIRRPGAPSVHTSVLDGEFAPVERAPVIIDVEVIKSPPNDGVPQSGQ